MEPGRPADAPGEPGPTHAVPPPRRAPELVLIVVLEVRPECVEECKRVLSASAQGSRREPGCLRFDVLSDPTRPCTIVTYEAFATPAAMDWHKEQPYVKAWGAFQYGPLKPIERKSISRLGAVDFELGAPRSRL